MPIIIEELDDLISPVFLEINKGPTEKWGDIVEDWNYWKRLDKYEQFNAIQRHKIRVQFEKMEQYPNRGKVTMTKLRKIYDEELKGRLYNYLNPMKKRILCIVGESGTGKTLVSLHLKNKLGANTICSYTTRPPRDDEEEGRDHHFIDIIPPVEELLAYTKFGAYEYYATRAQVHGPCTVYVIDENGLRDFKERWGGDYEIFSLYLIRNKKLRRLAEVDKKRMERDAFREPMSIDYYDYVVRNNGSKKELFEKVDKIYLELANNGNT